MYSLTCSSRLSLCLSLVARGVWWKGGKRGRKSSSLFPSRHPLLPPRALREDEWGRVICTGTMYACSIIVNMSFKESIILWILFFYRTERKTLRSSSRKWRKETQASWTVSGWKWKMKRNFEGFFFKSRQSSVVYIQKLVNTSTFTQVEQDTVADWCFDV